MNQLRIAELKRLSGHWEQIMQAHDTIEAATDLHTNDMVREFYLESIEQMARVENEAKESIREQAIYLVRDLNVAATTVAAVIGVASSTIGRWIDAVEHE